MIVSRRFSRAIRDPIESGQREKQPRCTRFVCGRSTGSVPTALVPTFHGTEKTAQPTLWRYVDEKTHHWSLAPRRMHRTMLPECFDGIESTRSY
jgi:hypothetical protein